MATTLTAVNTPERVTLDAVAGNSEAVTLPAGTRSVRLYFNGGTGQYAWSGTDGAAMGNDVMYVPQTTLVELTLPKTIEAQHAVISTTVMYLGSSLAGDTVQVEAVQ